MDIWSGSDVDVMREIRGPLRPSSGKDSCGTGCQIAGNKLKIRSTFALSEIARIHLSCVEKPIPRSDAI